MKMYKAQPKGLYLGRYDKGDEHLILIEDGTIKHSHSVRQIHYDIEKQLQIIERHDTLPNPKGIDQQIYDMTSINPLIDQAKLVASEAVGSKKRYRAISR